MEDWMKTLADIHGAVDKLVGYGTGDRDEMKRLVEACNERCEAADGVIRSLVADAEKSKILLADLDQYSRRFNLEIRGVPEGVGERAVVSQIARVLGVPKPCLVAAFRLGTSQPRTILVQFESQGERDWWLLRRKEYGCLRVSSLFPNQRYSNDRVYMEEQLTPERKRLFKAALDLRPGFKYVWVKGGKVYVKKNENSIAHRLSSIDDVSKLK
jgi:hypothetical protein